MSFFKPTRNADFMRTRTLFFVVALALNLIWSIVAALDVSSQDTRRSSSHVAIAAYNLAIQLFSFISVSSIAMLDVTVDIRQSWWFSHIFFEVAVFGLLATLQLAGALTYSALSPTFTCGTEVGGSSCTSFNRALLVGSWTITILYILFALWFATTVFVVSKHDPSVWRSRTRSFDWEAEGKPPLIIPSSPLDILGKGADGAPIMAQVKKPRRTWVHPPTRNQPRQRLDSTPHLPIQSLPPPTPFEPVPPIPEIYLAQTRQSVPEDVSFSEVATTRPLSVIASQPSVSLHTQPSLSSDMSTKFNKFMSIKPLRLHRPSASMDKHYPGFKRGLTISRPQMITTRFDGEMEAASKDNYFASDSVTRSRQYTDSSIYSTTMTPYSRPWSTGTVPPPPPPKDRPFGQERDPNMDMFKFPALESRNLTANARRFI